MDLAVVSCQGAVKICHLQSEKPLGSPNQKTGGPNQWGIL